MSSREPMWYCYECSSEMRPLMMPDPHCAVCRGTFVEKIENPNDDPRQYHQHGQHGPDLEADDDPAPFNPLDLFMGLQSMVDNNRPPSPQAQRPARDRPAPQFTVSSNEFSIRIDRSGNGPARTTFSSTRSPPTRSDSIPPIFGMPSGARDGRQDGEITGPLMFQYLLALLSQAGHGGRNGGPPPIFAELFGNGVEPGRMGDYVFTQDALDQILSQLMENTQSHPVPASEEIMQDLPRTVLEKGSPLLEKDCAVCKDQFTLETEDPAEQIVVTLPCKHPFHEPCIMPWLKSSGTCPVCRHELVPQPHHHGPGEGPSRRPTSPGSNNPDRPGSPGSGGFSGGGFGGSAFFGGPRTGTGGSNNTGPNGGDNNNNLPPGIFGTLINTLMSGAQTASQSSSSAGSGIRTTGAAAGTSTGRNVPSRHNSATDRPTGTSTRGNITGAGRTSPDRRRRSTDSYSSDGSEHVPGSWSDVD